MTRVQRAQVCFAASLFCAPLAACEDEDPASAGAWQPPAQPGPNGAGGAFNAAGGTGGFGGTGGLGGNTGSGGFGAAPMGGDASDPLTGVAGAGGAPEPFGAPPPVTGDPTFASASSAGTFTFQSYASPPTTAYASGTIYHPDGPGPFAVVAIATGWLEAPLAGWGEFLASHGFIAMAFEVNNNISDPPTARAAALIGALDMLVAEGGRAGSPLQGRVNVDRQAVLGHSLGGGGALHAAKSDGHRMRASVALTPCASPSCSDPPDVAPTFPGVTIPTLIIAAQNDGNADADLYGWPYYQTLTNAHPRIYAEFAGADHFIANEPTVGTDAARYVLSWLQAYVNDDVRYRQFLVPDPMFSRFDEVAP